MAPEFILPLYLLFRKLQNDLHSVVDVYDLEQIVRLKNSLASEATFDIDGLCTVKIPFDEYKVLVERMIIDGSFYYRHIDLLKKLTHQ